MVEADIILKFDIVEGKSPDLDNVIRALSSWSDLMKVAGSIVDPNFNTKVELVGVEEGSEKFLLALRKINKELHNLKTGAEEYDLIAKAAMMLGGAIGTTLFNIAVTPDPRIPEDQMEVFKEQNKLLEESNELERERQKYYDILQDEPAIESFEVTRACDNKVLYNVPRAQFATLSGLWEDDAVEEKPLVEKRDRVWDVILIKPVSVSKPRRWGFIKDGLEFSALMEDENILQAIKDKNLPIAVAEGVKMKIALEYKEEYNGEIWLPVKQSHKVKRVLEPLLPTATFGLFGNTNAPEKKG